MPDIPLDLMLNILTFCDIKTILNFRLISKSFYRYMKTPFVWKRLTFYLLTKTDLDSAQYPTKLNEVYSEQLFFEFLRILSTRDDITNAIQNNQLIKSLEIDWIKIAMIVRRSPLITAVRRSSIFNLEGSLELKQSYVHLLPIVGLNFTHVLR